jgi:Tfp pilus assembly protein PilV
MNLNRRTTEPASGRRQPAGQFRTRRPSAGYRGADAPRSPNTEHRTPNPRRRRGATLQEAIIAVTITIAVITGIAQLCAVAAVQRRVAEQRTLATWEAGNLMEDLVSRPWSEMTPEKLAAAELSDACRQNLPEAKARVEATPEGDGGEVVRLNVQIDWQNAAGQRVKPVRLVAWRYRDEEATR